MPILRYEIWFNFWQIEKFSLILNFFVLSNPLFFLE